MKIDLFGDRAIVARFEGSPSLEKIRKLSAFAAAARGIANVIDATPGFNTVLIEAHSEHRKAIAGLLAGLEQEEEVQGEGRPSQHVLRCIYDGEDLEWASNFLGLGQSSIISIHSENEYVVATLASPGFIYLSPVDPLIALPRLDEPRQSVPARSVGIGGSQTGIYGLARPGGWRIIGRITELPQMWPGDLVRFEPSD